MISVTIGGRTANYSTPREAVAAILSELPNDELAPLGWLDLIRSELRRRTVVKVFDWEPSTAIRAASAVRPSGSASSS